MFLEWMQRPASRAVELQRLVHLQRVHREPARRNFGLANLLLGNLNSYSESNLHPYAQGRYRQYEFFVQDNWRVKNNFTLDYGLRMYYIGPTFVAGQDIAVFDPSAYNPARAVELYQATCSNGAATCSGATRVAANPAGGTLPAFFIGKVIPGSGDLTNGMVIKQQTPFKGVFRPAPRIGFAWDVTGDGKTAVRGGWGMFYDRYGDDTVLRLIEPEPLVTTRTYNFLNINELATAAPVNSLLGRRARVSRRTFTPPTVYNWSIGVQRELPWKLVGDVAYVGNFGRDTSATYDANGLDYGTRRIDLNPSAADPTRNNTQAKDDFFFRPNVGYGGITEQEWRGYNSFHSIQLSVNRRLSNGFAWGLSYTGSTRRSLNTFNPFLSDGENIGAQRVAGRLAPAQPRRQLQLPPAEAQPGLGQRVRARRCRRLAGHRRQHVAERHLRRLLVRLQPEQAGRPDDGWPWRDASDARLRPESSAR